MVCCDFYLKHFKDFFVKPKFLLCLVLLVSFYFSGCAEQSYVEPEVDFSYVYPKAPSPLSENYHEGSIYHSGFKMNLFGNSQSWQVGDLITVTVNETSNVNTKTSNSTGRKATSSVSPPTLLGMTPAIGEVNLEMNLSTDNNSEGQYAQSQTQTISFQITATVAQILPNGNLVVKGEKEFFSNGTREFMSIRGVARPDDIYANNTIEANRLGDLTIQTGQNGQLFKGSDSGWLTKVLRTIYPF